jgi:hypothetical protein
MYAAARRWRDEALVSDQSLFGGHPIDGLRAADELVEFYVNNPDLGSGTFVAKLKTQLDGVSAAAVQVAAELLYIHTLVVSTASWSARSKAELISSVTGFRSTGVAAMPSELEAVLSGGAAGPGQAYLNYRWKMFAYLIGVFGTIKRLPTNERQRAVSSLESYRAALSGVDTQSVWSQQYAIEHLLFPDVAPPILSRQDRAKIVQAFPDSGSDIVEVCAHLEPNITYGVHAFVDPYLFPLRERWNPNHQEALYGEWARKIAAAVDLEAEERDYKVARTDAFRSAVHVAAIGGNPYSDLKTALTGFNVVDYRVTGAFLAWVEAHPATAADALTALQADAGPESIDRFLALVPWDDLRGTGARLSLASALLLGCAPEWLPPWRDTAARATQRLSGGYASEAAATAGEIYLAWLERLDMIMAAVNIDPNDAVLRDRLDAQGLAHTVLRTSLALDGWSAADLEALASWQQGRGTAPPDAHPLRPVSGPGPSPGPEPSQLEPFDQLVDDLYLDELGATWLKETLTLLDRKRQLIFQGPPGTGKTFMARRLARYLAGADDRLTTVQFHPGTSYEDFVQGLRPDPHDPSRFIVVDGPLIRIADAAEKNPTKTYVLLIDEINRGNIPAVFGELYLLLEYRNTPVTLLYGGRQKIPENLMIIGTMNTADRSITALDAALRRRFYIRDLRPDHPPVDGILRRYLATNAPQLGWLADLLDAANTAIGDADQYIGPSHFMGEVDEDWARRAWSYSVMPTLRELYYNDQRQADALEFDILREALTADVAIVE